VRIGPTSDARWAGWSLVGVSAFSLAGTAVIVPDAAAVLSAAVSALAGIAGVRFLRPIRVAGDEVSWPLWFTRRTTPRDATAVTDIVPFRFPLYGRAVAVPGSRRRRRAWCSVSGDVATVQKVFTRLRLAVSDRSR
jgi:hypothetical protein